MKGAAYFNLKDVKLWSEVWKGRLNLLMTSSFIQLNSSQ